MWTKRLARATPRIAAQLLIGLGFAVVASAPASSREIRFTRLVDDRTPLPDGSGSFGRFDDFVLDAAGNLAFEAGGGVFAFLGGEVHALREAGAVDGEVIRVDLDGKSVFWSEANDDHPDDGYPSGAILRWRAGSSRVLVDEQTPIPGTDCPFYAGDDALPEEWRIEDGGVLFFGEYHFPGDGDDPRPDCYELNWSVRGTFRWRDGVLERVPPTLIEDGGRSLTCRTLSREGDRVLRACGPPDSDTGLFLFEADGSHRRLVSPGDPIPGRSASFASVEGGTLRRGHVVFSAIDDTAPPGVSYYAPGIYAWDGRSLSTLLDIETIESDPRLDRWHWDPRFDGRNVAVHVLSLGPDLLHFARTDGSRRVSIELDVLDGRPVIVSQLGEFRGGWLPFTVFENYDDYYDHAHFVYAARPDGSLLRVLGPGDLLDGRTVSSLRLGRSTGSTLTLRVAFSDPACASCGFTSWDAIYAVELPPREVTIDVRPHDRRNRIRPGRKTLVPVAILGSPDLDVADVDAGSLAFGPDGAPPWRGRAVRRDVNGDGLDDLVARFRQRETGIARGDAEACLAGETTDSMSFEGCDAVRTPGVRGSAR